MTRPGPVLLASLGAAAIAFSAILVRLAEVTPSTAAFFRCAYALPALALLAGRERRRLPVRRLRERGLALGAGALLGVELVVWHTAIDDVGAGLATVLANLQVVVVAGLAWAVLGERPSRSIAAALPVVVAGAVLISGALEQGAYGRNPALGAAFGLLAATLWGGFLLLFRATGRDGAIAGPLFDVSLGGATAAAIVGAASGQLDLVPPVSAQGWLALYALTSQVFAFLLIGAALPRLSAALGSILLLLQPVASVVLAVALLGEAPTALQLVGVALLLGAVVVATTGRRSAGTAPPVAATTVEPSH